MWQAYNFLGSWQLFPEKGSYTTRNRPRSGIYKIEQVPGGAKLAISMSWVSLEGEAFNSAYELRMDGHAGPLTGTTVADTIRGIFKDELQFETQLLKSDALVFSVHSQLLPNGFLKISEHGTEANGPGQTNTEIYHRQLSVLPYSTAAGGALIRPNESGMIRHAALTAMEEQTNMQLDQIRKQVELLAEQAQDIQLRKELSRMIYAAKINFVPVIGNTYFLYEKKDGSFVLSLISAKEYGGGAGPYKAFIAAVKLLADHTWVKV